jgi:adenylate cyclase
MARNVEIKARVEDPDGLMERVAELADDGPYRLDQDDTFFHCPDGRLKLRQFGDGRGELIFYRRPDQAEPGQSEYDIAVIHHPVSLCAVLASALGIRGRVRKQRTLHRVGRTRVHLDHVDDLGHFMELEVVLAEGEQAESGVREAEALLDQLGIGDDALIEVAYIDLLDRVRRPT